MNGFFQKILTFMQGRYGMDTLNGFLIGLSVVIWIANIFVFNRIAHLIIMLIQFAILGWLVFRALSTNITKRSAENRAFRKVFDPVKNWVQLTFRKIRDRKDYRYIKCPLCKAQLRVKNVKGKHHVRCPKCHSEFEKKI